MKSIFIHVVFVALISAVAGIAGTAMAQSRPDTTRMSCAAARALVAKHGAIVMATGPAIFDRYVSSRAACLSTQQIESAFVATADDSQCTIGYTCREQAAGADR